MQSVPLLKQGAKAVVTGNYFQSWTNIGWLYTAPGTHSEKTCYAKAECNVVDYLYFVIVAE